MGDPACYRDYCPNCDLQVTITDEQCPECDTRLPENGECLGSISDSTVDPSSG